MGSVIIRPVAIGRNTLTNEHVAVVKVDEDTYEVWGWTPPARDYNVLLQFPASSVTRAGSVGYLTPSANDDFWTSDAMMMVMFDRKELYWRGNPLEWLEPSVWDIYTAASARNEHLVGAPIRRSSR